MAEYMYTEFKPETSQYAIGLLNKSPRELANRYFQKRQQGPAQYKTPFLKEVNKHDSQDILQNWRIYNIAGDNLDHVYAAMQKYVNLLYSLGYEFNYANLVADIDQLLGTNPKQILLIKKNKLPLTDYVRNVTYFFSHEILENKALEYVVPTQADTTLEK